jgi:hypothetical protein
MNAPRKGRRGGNVCVKVENRCLYVISGHGKPLIKTPINPLAKKKKKKKKKKTRTTPE